jgi:hypothetical protein
MSKSLPSGTWRDPILAHFSRDIASVARMTVVADPDELLTEQGIVDGIRERGFEIVPFDDAAARRFDELRRRKLRIGTRDLKIAATALVNNAVLLSANRADFERVPGLRGRGRGGHRSIREPRPERPESRWQGR